MRKINLDVMDVPTHFSLDIPAVGFRHTRSLPDIEIWCFHIAKSNHTLPPSKKSPGLSHRGRFVREILDHSRPFSDTRLRYICTRIALATQYGNHACIDRLIFLDFFLRVT